jgi:dihydroneopterin aldolase
MAKLITIELKQLRFFAYHGLYAEEQKTGNEFEITLAVSFSPESQVLHLTDTVDYVKLYELLKVEMQKPRHLLETLAMELAEIIHDAFLHVQRFEIRITKLQPPIAKFTGRVFIEYAKDF